MQEHVYMPKLGYLTSHIRKS